MRPIDADALKEQLTEHLKCCNAGSIVEACFMTAIDHIEHAPTITQPPNDPLTLSELREMEGEPVYCVSKAMPEDSAWGIVCLIDEDPYVRTMQNKGHISRFFYLTTYGSAWLAYRRRQEEGTT